MKTKLKIILFAVVIMFLFTSQTFAMGAGQKHEEEIRIGAVLPLTGNLSYLGSEEKNTLMLLEKNINEKNEIKLKIFFEDSKGTAKDGLTAFNKLKMEGIKYYITSLTIVSLAIAPLCNQNGFIQFALSVDPLIAGQNKNLICLYYNLADEMKLISKLLAFKKAKDVASIYINTPEDETAINKFFKSYLKDYNIKHLGNYTYGFADKSVKNQLLKLKALDPDYINTIDFGYMYPTILKEAQVLGIREKIIGGLGMMTAPPMDTFLLSNIYFCASSFVIKPTEKYKIFAKKYEEKYGKS
ncbi:MAG: ABC transporter substrate-binding protein, partial [Candidatus Thermoplasmatota archaeon]|nr:ABC transporter substrate-binding protein [Candidatus Thermoplasmatota archaeon]